MRQSLDPILVTLAGPNGSGKTTLTELIKSHEWLKGCQYINPDDIRFEIAKTEGVDPETDTMNLRAAEEADRRREELLSGRLGIAFETVFSTQGKLDFLHRAKAAGYFIRLFFVGTSDPSINVRRIAARVWQGGHPVPESKIHDRYYRSLALYTQAAKLVQRSYLYDNSKDVNLTTEKDYKLPIVFRTKDGVVVKAYQPYPAWTLPILRELPFAPDVALPQPDAPKNITPPPLDELGHV
jgi:predicted ABC-type ATPase